MTPHKDTVQAVLMLLKDTFKGGPFKEFYDGDPEIIPLFNLPAIVVSLASDTTDIETSAQDDITESVVIKVIYNKKDDWDDKMQPLNGTERKIREIIGMIDPLTGRYATNTIKHSLRTHLSDDNMILDDQMTTTIGISPRANDIVTAEGHVTISVRFSVDVR